ncbi:UDP-2,4-diacetamido-2,4,6-trideoxy-beta-L-altropyranose hydrolase [Pantoea sp. FN0302]|uniref:UDP-2,4-diacetamido-2,4, 6-trideoxy-beta-L-altropyranose hydrolase n=1 Tax=Pantoea sp. FN0302 TaxID=3418558 RepID=UPI003CF42552
MFKGKIVFFRTDASLNIGTGHVMRCLTLANALASLGAKCQFITRAHEGNIASHIEATGFTCHLLPIANSAVSQGKEDYARWLGCSQQQDAIETLAIINESKPDWLIVDHYALDENWELLIKKAVTNLMVIDDLANRKHQCELLLDQNLGRSDEDYQSLVPTHCQRLYGPQYALLRPEFSLQREASLAKRKNGKCESVLITLGGVDKDNITGQVLNALMHSNLPLSCHINVVMGASAPGIAQVKQAAEQLPWKTNVLVGVNDMANLMAESDLAIGAAGSTAWERCALGLPTIMIVIADNQYVIAKHLEEQKACVVIWHPQQISVAIPSLLDELISDKKTLPHMARICADITDGAGVRRVIKAMSENNG